MTHEHVETMIIGGGQAGLAVGYHLKSKGRAFVILDANERPGDAWRKRWPSLRLYSPATADGLPGMAFPAPAYSRPTGLEMADYLESYAERFELPIRSRVAVEALERDGNGYVATAGDRRFSAENVVVATGVFQHERPIIPEFASDLDPAIRQLHSADYRGPDPLNPWFHVTLTQNLNDIPSALRDAGQYATLYFNRTPKPNSAFVMAKLTEKQTKLAIKHTTKMGM